jgi:undecaprenyl-diphosphatase
MHHPPLLTRLDARDRDLFNRCAISPSSAAAIRLFWVTLTHLGGVWGSIAAAVLPLYWVGTARLAAERAILALIVSHLIVQVLKRHVVRERPARPFGVSLVAIPDKFSFPSGHAAAAMSVAFVYASLYPGLAVPLLVLSTAIGFSRVVLGVHYPSDVLAGQAIALCTAIVVLAM